MADITYTDSHATDALARLIEQYKGRPRMEAFIQAFADRVQDIEFALYMTLVESAIDDAVGAQLDVLGDLVGQDRQGMVDNEYRSFVKARIKANRSDGTIEQLIEIADLILESQDVPPEDLIEVMELYPATVLFEAFGVTANPLITWRDFLESAAAGGVRLYYSTNSGLKSASLIAEDVNGDFVPETTQMCSDANGDFDGGTTNSVFG
jgi:hypothetical protein